jgi:hypothetical protein
MREAENVKNVDSIFFCLSFQLFNRTQSFNYFSNVIDDVCFGDTGADLFIHSKLNLFVYLLDGKKKMIIWLIGRPSFENFN